VESIDYCQQLVATFESVLEALNKLCLHILDDLADLPLWVFDDKAGWAADRDKLVYVLKHMDHRPGLTPQETYVCPAVVACTTETIGLIEQVNAAKLSFKALVQAYLKFLQTNRTKVVRKLLADSGYGAVKLKQVYRTIHYLDYHPQRIAWLKSRAGSYHKLDIPTAKEMLIKAGQGEALEVQMSKLNLLNPDDSLVVYHPIKPCWGANITSFNSDCRRSTYTRLRKVGMPLFYLQHSDHSIPEVEIKVSDQTSSEQKNGVPKYRRDKLIENQPFLTLIHAYRQIIKMPKGLNTF